MKYGLHFQVVGKIIIKHSTSNKQSIYSQGVCQLQYFKHFQMIYIFLKHMKYLKIRKVFIKKFPMFKNVVVILKHIALFLLLSGFCLQEMKL